jgi:hypothetical protein
MAIQRKKPIPRKTAKANEAVPLTNTTTTDAPLPKPIDKPRTLWDKFIYFIQLRDAFWSVPVWVILTYLVGAVIAWATDYTSDFYNPGFIQPLFIAGSVVIGGFGISGFVIYFNFRHIQRYVYGKAKDKEGIIKNQSKEDWDNMQPWQKIIFSLFMYCLPVVLVAVVFIKIVAKA